MGSFCDVNVTPLVSSKLINSFGVVARGFMFNLEFSLGSFFFVSCHLLVPLCPFDLVM
jgi:hypothetical protein